MIVVMMHAGEAPADGGARAGRHDASSAREPTGAGAEDDSPGDGTHAGDANTTITNQGVSGFFARMNIRPRSGGARASSASQARHRSSSSSRGAGGGAEVASSSGGGTVGGAAAVVGGGGDVAEGHRGLDDPEGRTEDMEAALGTARGVVAHLDDQVRALTADVNAAEADKEALHKMLANLGALLKQERTRCAHLLAGTERRTEQEEEGLAGGECASGSSERPAAGTTAAEDVVTASSGAAGGDGCAPGSAGGPGGVAATASVDPGEGWEVLPALVKDGISGGWLVEPSEVVEGDVLGSGCSGVTVRGKWHGQPVAVKKVNVEGKSRAASFLREVRVLSRLRHPHILPFYGACLQPPGRCWILTHLCEGGTLKERLRHWSPGGFTGRMGPALTLRQRLTAAWEVARGMRYLEEATPTVMHRDLKPSNVFLTSREIDARALVADFGLARWLPHSDEVLTGETGTYLYMAPEVIRHEPHYTGLADSYSFGVMLNELICGQIPYEGDFLTPLQVASAVADGKLRPSVTGADKFPGLAAIVQACFEHDPAERPTFARIVDSMDAMLPEILEEIERGSEGGGLAAVFKNMFG